MKSRLTKCLVGLLSIVMLVTILPENVYAAQSSGAQLNIDGLNVQVVEELSYVIADAFDNDSSRIRKIHFDGVSGFTINESNQDNTKFGESGNNNAIDNDDVQFEFFGNNMEYVNQMISNPVEMLKSSLTQMKAQLTWGRTEIGTQFATTLAGHYNTTYQDITNISGLLAKYGFNTTNSSPEVLQYFWYAPLPLMTNNNGNFQKPYFDNASGTTDDSSTIHDIFIASYKNSANKYLYIYYDIAATFTDWFTFNAMAYSITSLVFVADSFIDLPAYMDGGDNSLMNYTKPHYNQQDGDSYRLNDTDLLGEHTYRLKKDENPKLEKYLTAEEVDEMFNKNVTSRFGNDLISRMANPDNAGTSLSAEDISAIRSINTNVRVNVGQGVKFEDGEELPSDKYLEIKYVPGFQLQLVQPFGDLVFSGDGVRNNTDGSSTDQSYRTLLSLARAEDWNGTTTENVLADYDDSHIKTYYWFTDSGLAWGNTANSLTRDPEHAPVETLFNSDDTEAYITNNYMFQFYLKPLVEGISGMNPEDQLDSIIKHLEEASVSATSALPSGMYTFYTEYRDSILALAQKMELETSEVGEVYNLNEIEEYFDSNYKDDFTVVWAYYKSYYLRSIGEYSNLKYFIDFDGNQSSYSPSVSPGLTAIKEKYDGLPDAEKLLIYREFIEKVNAYKVKYPNATISTETVNWGAPSAEYNESAIIQFDPEAASEVVNTFDSSQFLFTAMVTEVIRYANVATNYSLLTGLFASGQGDNTIYDFYNVDVDKMMQGIFSNASENSYKYYPRIPKMNDASYLINNNNYQAFFAQGTDLNVKTNPYNRMLYLYMNIEYASAILQYSDWAKENQYTFEDVEAYLSSPAEESEDNPFMTYPAAGSVIDNEQALLQFLGWTNTVSSLDQAQELSNLDTIGFRSEYSKDLMRTIIQVHDMAETLNIGVGDWSPTLDKLLNLYASHEKLFNALRKNVLLWSLGTKGNITNDEPLGMFFKLGTEENSSSIEMTDEWMKGFAASATFVPFETNLYDANSIKIINDSSWISDFYYKYGFYRKALLINTDNSVLVNKTITSSYNGGTRYATLRDLLNYDRDIVLYIDDNFYNADQISAAFGNIDYMSVRGYNNNTSDDEAISKTQQLNAAARDVTDLQPDVLLKTGNNVYYSEALAQKVTKLNETSTENNETVADTYLLAATDIIGTENNPSVFKQSEYSVQVPFGVVSSVYRSAQLYNAVLHGIVTDNAIFKSSKAICNIEGTHETDWWALYNYLMLSNMDAQMHNDSANQLDLDAPIFCDLFGNIVTESGLVIIPAASNATLCRSKWNPYTVGFAEYYSNGNYLKESDFSESVVSWLIGQEFTRGYQNADLESIAYTGTIEVNNVGGNNNASDRAGAFFVLDSNGNFLLKETQLSYNSLSVIVNWSIINKNSSSILQLFYNNAYFDKAKNVNNYRTINMICEVLRGAPLEFIDYSKEQITSSRDVSKYGVYIAYKLEEVADALTITENKTGVGNSMISIPNISYLPGIEGIMLYVYKAIFALVIIAFVVSLYLDATRNSLGIKSAANFLITIMMVIVGMTFMPKVLNWSYYGFNKYLLGDESSSIMMLNYVKEFDGTEIGVTKVTTPESDTKLYLKVGNLDVSWWEVTGEVLFGDTNRTIKEMYSDMLSDNMMANEPKVIQRNDGLYMNLQDIFDSTNTMYKPSTNTLFNTVPVSGEAYTSASFVTPYYIILDQLVNNINYYNSVNNIQSYSYSIGTNGHICTYDIISPYLKSNMFLEDGYDITGLFNVYHSSNVTQKINYNPVYLENVQSEDGSVVNKVKLSAWYMDGMENNADVLLDKLNQVENYARDYIVRNKESLGKVPDEVFLKVLAMQIAIKYNQVFGVTAANAIELVNIDTRDLLRFMVASPDQVYRYYSYSFARFVYEVGGGLAVVFAGMLLTAVWLASLLKPLLLISFFALLCVNIILRKLIFNSENKAIQGYFIGCGALALFNGLYAIMIKACMLLAHYNLGVLLTLILGIIVQFAYVASLIILLVLLIKDYKNNGFTQFSTYGQAITSRINNVAMNIQSRLVASHNSAYAESASSRKYQSSDYGPGSINDMLERDREREERGTFSPV